MKRRVLSKTTSFHIRKKKKRKARTVSFWTTLFIFLHPLVWTTRRQKPFLKNRPASLSSPPPPPNASMADQQLRDWRHTNKRHTCSVFFSINRETEGEWKGGKNWRKKAGEREERRNNTEAVEKRTSQPSVSNHQQNHHQHHCQLLYPSSSSQVTLPMFIFLHCRTCTVHVLQARN